MSFPRPIFRRFWLRRSVAAALLLLQAAVAISPIAEPPAQRPMGAHMEGQGARHIGLHNETTCLTCAVRAMHAAPAEPGRLADSNQRVAGVEPAHAALPAVGGAFRTNRSRAPPALA